MAPKHLPHPPLIHPLFAACTAPSHGNKPMRPYMLLESCVVFFWYFPSFHDCLTPRNFLILKPHTSEANTRNDNICRLMDTDADVRLWQADKIKATLQRDHVLKNSTSSCIDADYHGAYLRYRMWVLVWSRYKRSTHRCLLSKSEQDSCEWTLHETSFSLQLGSREE